MPTLDVRGEPIGANITVNYSSLLPMTPHMKKQLEDAVALARDTIIRVNTDVYKPLYNFVCGGGLKTWEKRRSVPTTEENPFSGNPWYFDDLIPIMRVHLLLHFTQAESWTTSITRTMRSLNLIETGLCSGVTISDARSRIIGAMLDASSSFGGFVRDSLRIEQKRASRPRNDNWRAEAVAALTSTDPGAPHALNRSLWRETLQLQLQNLAYSNLHITKEVAEEIGQRLGYVTFRGAVRQGNDLRVDNTALERKKTKEIIDENYEFLYENEHMMPQFRRSIHVNFGMLEDPKVTLPYLAHLILHEASHKFAGTEDFAYSFQSQYRNITPAQAANNADSLALTVACMKRKSFVLKAEQL